MSSANDILETITRTVNIISDRGVVSSGIPRNCSYGSCNNLLCTMHFSCDVMKDYINTPGHIKNTHSSIACVSLLECCNGRKLITVQDQIWLFSFYLILLSNHARVH